MPSSSRLLCSCHIHAVCSLGPLANLCLIPAGSLMRFFGDLCSAGSLIVQGKGHAQDPTLDWSDGSGTCVNLTARNDGGGVGGVGICGPGRGDLAYIGGPSSNPLRPRNATPHDRTNQPTNGRGALGTAALPHYSHHSPFMSRYFPLSAVLYPCATSLPDRRPTHGPESQGFGCVWTGQLPGHAGSFQSGVWWPTDSLAPSTPATARCCGAPR